MLKVIFVPDSALWLKMGPLGIMNQAQEKLKTCEESQKEFL